MRFDEAVAKIPNITDLRRVARAHVVDHRQLSNEALEAAILKSKPQYVDRCPSAGLWRQELVSSS
jgi:hypothetical protein